MVIEYDTPIEVTENQYNVLMRELSGLICGRSEGGKFYIKLWYMRYAPLLESLINPT